MLETRDQQTLRTLEVIKRMQKENWLMKQCCYRPMSAESSSYDAKKIHLKSFVK
ncbi:uncharacterized protein PHALS_00915 [Plasmopara halstedii]|uniref:Uncharacterized protein n=1 Tax=Plasmopara halstedii TaxID=4781 RepID=A0A0P1AS16_PLAHL|nr:uncharacterized protein PHALS_00915 [Plasmopara halstedii]CEG44564.1 hypothetical protein PHALS_00915 [Plasmopara halstedii]|eukprot:XP_024580933.1 hypothetical protein PHALS_00915 [Plasmopara halstedii]